MNKENLPVVRRTTVLDKLKNALKSLFGNKKPEKVFTNDTLPNDEQINTIKMMEIVQSEIKLRNAIRNNSKLLVQNLQGVTEKDAENILLWVVQNARESIFQYSKEEYDENQTLEGLCGFGQALTAIPLIRMGLKPNINQIAKTIDEAPVATHAFVTVAMPIMQGDSLIYKPYLIDTTFRQFFQTKGTYKFEKEIKDREFGTVTPNEGYFLSKKENGIKFSNELLKMGFVELTLENAKLYGDAFVNAATRLKTYDNKAPTSKELETGIPGDEYIRRFFDPKRQEEKDFEETELEMLNYNIKTPLQQNQDKTMTTQTAEINQELPFKVKQEEKLVR